MKRFFIVSVAAVALGLAGCSSHVGNEYKVENTSQLVPGKTTYTEAQALLGKPVAYKMVPEGRKVRWLYSEAHQAVPIVPVFKGHSNYLDVLFDHSDVMVGIIAQGGSTAGNP